VLRRARRILLSGHETIPPFKRGALALASSGKAAGSHHSPLADARRSLRSRERDGGGFVLKSLCRIDRLTRVNTPYGQESSRRSKRM